MIRFSFDNLFILLRILCQRLQSYKIVVFIQKITHVAQMKYGQVVALLDETGLSPENLVEWLSVSNSTYRRWLKAPSGDKFPKEYESNVAAGVYKLLDSKLLNYDSVRVNKFVEGHMPEFFQAAVGRLDSGGDLFSEGSNHQDKVIAVLSNLGNSNKIRNQVDGSSKKILKFAEWGAAWKDRIKLMTRVITSKELSLVDQLVAYGALFYLILPFDLIPDSIPVFGYIDDFGILGFASVYYTKRFPKMVGKQDD